MNPLIYVVDDDPSFRLLLERVLAKDFTLKTFSRAQDCLDAIDVEPPALVLTDYTMPDINGVELTGIIRKKYPSVAVIVLTGYGSVESAVEALKAGAFHYIEKNMSGAGATANFTVLRTLIARAIESASLKQETARYKSEVEQLKRKVRQTDAVELVGNSPAICALRTLIEQVARTDSTVLIRGETGTGKTVVARLIHRLSPRDATGELVEINCAAIPDNLLEAELFGYEPAPSPMHAPPRKGSLKLLTTAPFFSMKLMPHRWSCSQNCSRYWKHALFAGWAGTNRFSPMCVSLPPQMQKLKKKSLSKNSAKTSSSASMLSRFKCRLCVNWATTSFSLLKSLSVSSRVR